jgi:metallo-beta-lactamase class B
MFTPLRCMVMATSLATSLVCGSAVADSDAMDAPIPAFKVYGTTYYVGMQGLGLVLITSPQGHILIDGGFPGSPPVIAASIRSLGFKVEDIKLIFNSHDHIDHAGGIAALQRMSGATVVASPSSASALRQGRVGADDPQLEGSTPYPPVTGKLRTVSDGEVVTLGPLSVTALYTPGHTPGGMSWSWTSCESGRCVGVVFADSINPISSDNFKFTASTSYPAILQDFERSYATLNKVRCDVLIPAHPDFYGSPAKRLNGALVGDGGDCRRYVETSRAKLNQRLASEQANKP